MCLLIVGSSDTIRSQLLDTKGLLEDIYTANSDGLGLMFAVDSHITSHKYLPRSAAQAAKFLNRVMPRDDTPIALHWRMKTHGLIDMENCHPYEINAHAMLMHNGILHTGNKKDPKRSDTWHFARDYLSTMDADQLHNEQFRTLLGEFIGNNRFAILTSDGRMSVVNRDQGIEHEGVWYSNTYAWDPALLIPGYRKADKFSGFGYSSYQGWVDDDWFNRPVKSHTTRNAVLLEPEIESHYDIAELVYQALADFDVSTLAECLQHWPADTVSVILSDFLIEPNKTGTTPRAQLWITADDDSLYAMLQNTTHPDTAAKQLAEALIYDCHYMHHDDIDMYDLTDVE